jgi:hypothetical protein
VLRSRSFAPFGSVTGEVVPTTSKAAMIGSASPSRPIRSRSAWRDYHEISTVVASREPAMTTR